MIASPAHPLAHLVALGLTTGGRASRGHRELDVKQPVTYAKEIFGGTNPDNLDLTLAADAAATADSREGTRVELQLALPAGTNVAVDSEAEVTITLAGAVFGQSVNRTDITTGIDLAKVSGSRSGGRAGDASITVKVRSAGISGTSGAEATTPDEIDDKVVEWPTSSVGR